MRSKLVFIFIFCFLLLHFPVSIKGLEGFRMRLLRVSLIEGDVSYQRTDLDKWVDLSVNTPLLEGDKVWVGREGRAEIEFDDGSRVRLAGNTIIELTRLSAQDALQEIEIRLTQGLATLGVRSGDGSFRVQTPSFSLQVMEPANFRAEVQPDGSGRVVVFEGKAEIDNQAAKLTLNKGENVQFLSEDPDRYYLGLSYEQDDWDRWNSERDEYLAQATRLKRSLPYDSGWNVGELDSYGSWYSVPNYGTVWRPNYDSDWVPFRDGRWTWYDPFGWTWISYEPWGWLPYHYGRWAYVGNYGWSWVPGLYRHSWCPGAVSWIQGHSWVGWVPLAPYEPWYPYGSVNIFVSKNYRYRNGISCLPNDGFINGTPHSNFRPSGDPLVSGRIIAGQPRLSPTTLSRMPVVNTYAGRRFTNEDLDARRNLRERMVQTMPSGSTANYGPAQRLNEMQDQRSRVMSREPSSDSGIRVINGGSNIQGGAGSERGVRVYSNSDPDRERVRAEQRSQIQQRYSTSPARSDTTRPQPQSPTTRQQAPRDPTSRDIVVSPNIPRTNPSVSQSPREQIRQVYRGRSEGNVVDRYSSPQQRGYTGSQYNNRTPYSPPVQSRPSVPPVPLSPRSQPVYTPPAATRPAPSWQSPPASAPRASTSPAQSSGRASGMSQQEGRSAVRGRVGR
jgi:hypothetical protein